MFTHTITNSFTRPGESLSGSKALTADQENNFDASIAIGTNVEADWTTTLANLQSLYILANGDLTIKTNSTGAPQETINLTAGVPLIWFSGDGPAAPFAGNVTKLYITNSTAGAVTLQIRSLVDSTP